MAFTRCRRVPPGRTERWRGSLRAARQADPRCSGSTKPAWCFVVALVSRACSWALNHGSVSCEPVSHRHFWRQNAGKLGEGGEGTSGMTPALPAPQFLMEISPSPPAVMTRVTSPTSIGWSAVANVKCTRFIFTSQSNVATGRRLK